MKRGAKIAMLNSWGVKIPDNATNAKLDELIASNQKASREIKNEFGKLTASFDRADNSQPVEVLIYQDIGEDPWGGNGFTAKDFRDLLKDIDRNRPIDLRINSAGGNVWDGLAIKTAIDEWKGRKTASIDGMAASVASWMAMGCDEIRAPKHAQLFVHRAWGICMGNDKDMLRSANDLLKTSNQIAQIYADRSGMSAEDCLDLMDKETLMTGEEAYNYGFIDRLTDDKPVSNFTDQQLKNMKSKLAVLNKFNKTAPQGGQHNNTENKMNRKQQIALLNKWGITLPENCSDELLTQIFNAAKANHKPTFKNGMDGDHDDECDCADCMGSKNAPEPKKLPDDDADANPPGKAGDEGELWRASTENAKKSALIVNQALESVNKFLANQRRTTIQDRIQSYVSEGRIMANSAKKWLGQAVAATDDENGENPILNLIADMPARLPGREPLNIIEVGESDSVADLDKRVKQLSEVQDYYSRNGSPAENLHDRILIGQNSKAIALAVNKFKKYDAKTGEMTGPIRDMWDKMVISPRNANTMSTGLLRQVILSEAMRAFRREFTTLSYFAHNFGNIPLEGTDVVQVPYYPLANTASTEFLYANGYQIAANANTQSKNITVGGIGNGVATPGSGRKYQTLQFTAYQIRRQPWLDIQKLSVMAGEQLAIDVRADIIGTQICAANFGNAIWTGAAGGFDHTVLGGVLMLAANNAFWPIRGRNVVVGTGYHANLSIDPGLYPYLYSGSTEILDRASIKNKYGFENVDKDVLLPIANYIQGGSGNNVVGLDPNLAGYICWPSAVLIATAPIMPPPGVLKKLVAYEQVTDDQTNLAFTYQFFGNETANADSEIIECTYGSGLGELKALFRLTSQGN